MPKSDSSQNLTVRKQLLEAVQQCLERDDHGRLGGILSQARSSDLAEIMELLDDDRRQILFGLLDAHDAGEVLEKVDSATMQSMVEDLSADDLGDILETLPPDEAADLVAELDDKTTEQVLEHLDKAESDRIEQLLHYDEDSAGGIMTPDMVALERHQTVADALEAIRQTDPDEDYLYVFVVDPSGRYLGSIGFRQLLRYPAATALGEIIETDDLPVVHCQMDQEEVANVFRKNDLMVVPVVDDAGALLGRITVDDIVEVMEEEAEEDVLTMAGTHRLELDSSALFLAAGVRLSWLLTCLIGSLFSGAVVYAFHDSFMPAQFIAVMMFMPAIAAMGGNSGLQTSTIVVRGLATGDLAAFNIGQVFRRESRVAVIVAVVCAIIAGVMAWCVLNYRAEVIHLALPSASVLALAVGMAMFCGIMLATTLGFILPFLFRQVGIDPAISSGPLVTTANDTLSYLTYFSLALALLKLLT